MAPTEPSGKSIMVDYQCLPGEDVVAPGDLGTSITSFHAILRHFQFTFEAFSISILLANWFWPVR